MYHSSEKIQGYGFLSIDFVCKGKTPFPVVNTLSFSQAMNELELVDIYRPVLTTCICLFVDSHVVLSQTLWVIGRFLAAS